jgi:hypothetical protein
VQHGRDALFQMAEAARPHAVFAGVLDRIKALRGRPAEAACARAEKDQPDVIRADRRKKWPDTPAARRLATLDRRERPSWRASGRCVAPLKRGFGLAHRLR